MDDICSHI